MGRAWVVLTVVLSAASFADEVYLQNGDRVSGILLEISPASVIIDTPYAGTLTLDREAVAGVTATGEFSLHLDDGGHLTGRLFWGEEGQFVDSDGYAGPMNLGQITEARPPAAHTEPVEEAPATPEPSPWSGTIQSGLSMRSGNTDTADFTFSAKAVRKHAQHELTFKAAGAYGEAAGVINTRRASGEARWQFYTSERSYLYVLGGAERDDGRKLDLRLSAAAGAGYDFIENEVHTFSADAGLEYNWARWEPFTPWGRDDALANARTAAYSGILATLNAIGAGGVNLDNLERLARQLVDVRYPLRDAQPRREDSVSLRLGAHYTRKAFKHSTLTGTLALYPNIDQVGEFRGISELAFDTPLTEALKLSISLRTEYDSLAGDQGVDPWDSTLVTGLRYDF